MSSSDGPSADRRFWRALASGSDDDRPEQTADAVSTDVPGSPEHVELTHDPGALDPEEREERKQALMNMLSANQARQQDALRNRRPAMTAGQRVAIISGQLGGKQGVVMDADFIHGRVQLDVDGLSELQWVSFKRVRSA